MQDLMNSGKCLVLTRFSVSSARVLKSYKLLQAMGLGICSLYIIYFNLLFVYYACIFMIGIHTTRKITLEVLSTKLCGFLEFIPKTHFRQLQRLHYYKSLYSFEYEDPEDLNSGNTRPRTKTYDFILFGPLAICNSDDEVSVRFSTSTIVMVLFSFVR